MVLIIEDQIISSLITLIIALISVYFAQKYSSCNAFNQSKHGLISETNANLVTIKSIMDQIKQKTRDGERDFNIDFHELRFVRLKSSAFDYYKNRGYLFSINDEIKRQLEDIYWYFDTINDMFRQYDVASNDPETNKIILSDIEKVQGIANEEFLRSILNTKCLKIVERINNLMELKGHSIAVKLQVVSGTILMIFGLIIMFSNLISGITIIGVGIAILSFAVADHNQREIMKKLDEINK